MLVKLTLVYTAKERLLAFLNARRIAVIGAAILMLSATAVMFGKNDYSITALTIGTLFVWHGVLGTWAIPYIKCSDNESCT